MWLRLDARPFPSTGVTPLRRYYGPLRLPLRSRPLHGDSAYRVRRSQATPEMAPQGSHCWGGDGHLLFPRWLSHHSTPSTPSGSSGLRFQVLDPFHGLRHPPTRLGSLLAPYEANTFDAA